MARYIQFMTGDEKGTTILVEVDEEEISSSPGLAKAGIREMLKDTVVVAETTLAAALKHAIQTNVQGLLEAVHGLPELPTDVEISFGLKATGEIGNVAVGKAGAEVNYTVKLVWKQLSQEKS